jgi:phosphoglycolate phosphatase
MIKYIIFDWSGVIKDSAKEGLCVVNKIFESYGVKALSQEEFQANWEQPYMNFFNKYLPDLTLAEEQVVYKKALAQCPKSKPYPGIVELLKEFQTAGIKMAVLSSDFPETLLLEIKDFGLEQVFVDVVTNVHNKQEAIPGLLERNNFDKTQTIFLGDSNHEIESGKNTDLLTGAITWGYSCEEKLKALNPDFMIRNLENLKRVIFSS